MWRATCPALERSMRAAAPLVFPLLDKRFGISVCSVQSAGLPLHLLSLIITYCPFTFIVIHLVYC